MEKIETQFDLDWAEHEIVRELWIFEGDGDPQLKKLDITLKKDGIGFNFERNFEVDNRADTKNTTLYHEWVERDNYMANNKTDNEHGFVEGFPVYHADHLYWTTPIREIKY